MIRGEKSDSIPIDLIIEILSRLPAKSIARCRCVSKLWGSIDLFLTRPRFLFAVQRDNNHWCFFSSPQPQNPYEEKSSRVVAADFHMNFLGDYTWLEICGHASGLIYYHPHSTISEEDKYHVICNPSTGQFVRLPLPKGRCQSLLGFDPIDKQFKVLSINDEKEEPCQILTLGTGNDSWRKIHCPLNHLPCSQRICINGVLYYLAEQTGEMPFIVCFDVRAEKFTFINKGFMINYRKTYLVNYKGKLGVITLEYDHNVFYFARRSVKLRMRVIKDVDKSEWSEYVYTFLKNQAVGCNVSTYLVNEVVDDSFSVEGVTATGDIVLSKGRTHPYDGFYAIYINPQRNTLQSVEIKGLEIPSIYKEIRRVRVIVDHVEDLNFITMKKMKTSISLPERKPIKSTFESINKFDSLCLLDDDCSL